MCKIYIVSKDFGAWDLKMKIHSSWSQEAGVWHSRSLIHVELIFFFLFFLLFWFRVGKEKIIVQGRLYITNSCVLLKNVIFMFSASEKNTLETEISLQLLKNIVLETTCALK